MEEMRKIAIKALKDSAGIPVPKLEICAPDELALVVKEKVNAAIGLYNVYLQERALEEAMKQKRLFDTEVGGRAMFSGGGAPGYYAPEAEAEVVEAEVVEAEDDGSNEPESED